MVDCILRTIGNYNLGKIKCMLCLYNHIENDFSTSCLVVLFEDGLYVFFFSSNIIVLSTHTHIDTRRDHLLRRHTTGWPA